MISHGSWHNSNLLFTNHLLVLSLRFPLSLFLTGCPGFRIVSDTDKAALQYILDGPLHLKTNYKYL